MRSVGIEKKIRSRAPTRVETSFLKQFFKGFLRLLGVVLLFVITYYVTRLSVFTITNIEVFGGETISHDEVRAHVEDELVGTYMLIIPKRFTYLYPERRIYEVLEKTPRIHDIQIVRTTRTTLTVTFQEYVPHALWCISKEENVPCFFLNKEGYAFAEAPLLQGGTLIRHIAEGETEISRAQVINADLLARIDAFIVMVDEKLHMRITSVLHKKNGDLELYVSGGGTIFAPSTVDFTTTFNNLQSVLASKEFTHIKPGNFNYIDVRFNNKVFVNEEMGSTTNAIATTTATST